MTATRLDLTIEQGADYDGSFLLGFDPTGHMAVMQLRPYAGYPLAVLTLRSGTGGLLIDGPGRKVTPVIPASVTAALNAGRYAYDLKLTAPSGRVIRAYQGSAHVSQQVTDIVELLPSGLAAFRLEDGSYLLLESGGRLLLDAGFGGNVATGLLLENGDRLLLEDGGRVLLEDGLPAVSMLALEGGGRLLNETGGTFILEL